MQPASATQPASVAHRLQPRTVGAALGQRQVPGRPLPRAGAGLVGEADVVGEPAGARVDVDGAVEHVVAVVEDRRRAVAVVGVDVDDPDPRVPAVAEPLGRQRGVVEVAGAAVARRGRVVARRTAQGVRRSLAGQHQVGRVQGTGGGGPDRGPRPGPEQRHGVVAEGADLGVHRGGTAHRETGRHGRGGEQVGHHPVLPRELDVRTGAPALLRGGQEVDETRVVDRGQRRPARPAGASTSRCPAASSASRITSTRAGHLGARGRHARPRSRRPARGGGCRRTRPRGGEPSSPHPTTAHTQVALDDRPGFSGKMRSVPTTREGTLSRARRRFRLPALSEFQFALRLTVAAVLSYVVATLIFPEAQPLLAPLTAMLVVQVTPASLLARGLDRVIAVVAGVSIAVGFATLVPLEWWTLGLLILVRADRRADAAARGQPHRGRHQRDARARRRLAVGRLRRVGAHGRDARRRRRRGRGQPAVPAEGRRRRTPARRSTRSPTGSAVCSPGPPRS